MNSWFELVLFTLRLHSLLLVFTLTSVHVVDIMLCKNVHMLRKVLDGAHILLPDTISRA